MVQTSPEARVLRFGSFEADLSTGELRRDGVRVPFQDKPFQILALLIERRGELVTREELRSRLWPADTFVDFEHGLNTAVKKLRQALDDSADEPRYVETLPRRGYRFLAPVAAESVAENVPVRTARTPRRLVVLGVVAFVLAGLLLWRLRSPSASSARTAGKAPVIVLMDSPLPGRVYDPRTDAAGGTNADDLTDPLRDLPVLIEKENTSPMWHREDQVLRQRPDLIVSHLSCLFDERVAAGQTEVLRRLFDAAVERLLSFFAYVASNSPGTRFLIYSRGK